MLQARDRHLLRELGTMRVVCREQAMQVGGFGSGSRTSRRLRKLAEAGLLRRFFLGAAAGGTKILYSLSEKGARLAEVPHRGFRRTNDQALIADFSVQHQLAINDLYCALKYGGLPFPAIAFRRWVDFQQPLAPGLRLIPDGYVEFQTPDEIIGSFIEVDLGHERLKVWTAKVENYLQLARSGHFEDQFGLKRFRTLVIARTPGRMLSIRGAVAPLTEKIFWFANLEAISREGVFGPIWLRPRNHDRQPLFRETL